MTKTTTEKQPVDDAREVTEEEAVATVSTEEARKHDVAQTSADPRLDEAEAKIGELQNDVKTLLARVASLVAALELRKVEHDTAIRERDAAREESAQRQARISALESKSLYRHGDDGMVQGGR